MFTTLLSQQHLTVEAASFLCLHAELREANSAAIFTSLLLGPTHETSFEENN